MSDLFQVLSTSDTDSSVYEMDSSVSTDLLIEWELHNLLTPDLPFVREVIVKEDGEPKVYAACSTRHSGWGLKMKFAHKIPPLWLEFIRSAP